MNERQRHGHGPTGTPGISARLLAAASLIALGVGTNLFFPATHQALAFECTNAGVGATAPDDNGSSLNTACGNAAIASGSFGSTAVGNSADATGSFSTAIGDDA